MNISIIGAGYVGLSAAAGFALKGHKIICVDNDASKVNAVNAGKPYFYEEGMEKALSGVIKKKLLQATDDTNEAVKNSDITFICVGTPSDNAGKIDLSHLKTAAEEVGKSIKGMPYHVVVVKSTVLPETTEKTVLPILKKNSDIFGLCMNPEFLREGKALQDFLHPDRIVIGELDKKSGDALEKLYKEFHAPIIRTSLTTAEMVKYASNVFLASRISLINEIGNICKKLNIDVYDVAKSIGHDKRIGPLFLEAGAGFGGSCFPKDISALMHKSTETGNEPAMMREILNVNKRQRKVLVDMLKNEINLKGKKIAVLGLAFKEGTDDIRESPAIDIIRMLKDEGALVYAYDPKAMDNMKKIYSGIKYENLQNTLENADACILLTEWNEFMSLTDRDFSRMKNKIVIEARKILDPRKVSGFEGICW